MATELRKTFPRSPRILVVDDDPGQRSLLDSFLRSQKFETVLVDSGMKALETLRAGKFDMMISDVRMPGLSGLETLRLARQEHATLPVLLITAFTDVRDAVAAMRDGTTNLITGLVERNRMFWIENVPLNGTNQISLQAMDAAGNLTVTNFIVKPSTIQLTIDSTPTGVRNREPVKPHKR